MSKKQVSQDSKDIKEVTLYNFTSLRNPEYLNKEALKNNPNYISYDPEFFRKLNLEEAKKLNATNFDEKLFLDFEFILFHDSSAGNKAPKHEGCEIIYSDKDVNDEDDLSIVLNRFFDKILNIYKNEHDNFYKIYHLIIGEDRENNTKVMLYDEKLFQEKVWRSFVYNIKKNDDFKQKEIATNLLRYFHLRNFKHQIDFESPEEKKENFDKLINAKIIIPEELFPKSETYFYGEKSKVGLKVEKPTPLFINQHYLKILRLREIAPDNVIQKTIDEIDKRIKEDKDEVQNEIFSHTTFIATIQKIESENYLLISISDPNTKAKPIIQNATLKFKENIPPTTPTITETQTEAKFKNRQIKFLAEKTSLLAKTGDLERSFYEYISNWDLYFNLNSYFDIDPSKEEARDRFKFSLDVEYANHEIAKTKGILTLQVDELKKLQKEIEGEIEKNKKGEQVAPNVELNYEGCGILSDENDFFGKAFKPSGFGLQLLGFADYRKVVSTISRYVPAEVAHIENIMASEFREKVTTKELTTEITEFESTETETENLNELTTNDRFQMQNEVAQILNDERKNNLDTKFTYSGGNSSATLTTGSSTANSKEESNKQAITNAKEITNKAVEKIVSKVKRERTTKTTEKFIDVNKYGFDNRGNPAHVSGVYRHINAVYRNRIQNYGQRLTYEFSIPEPALVHKKGIIQDDYDLISKINQITPPKPTNPFDFITSKEDLNKDNYIAFKKMFGVDLDDYPKKEYKEFKHSFQFESEPANIAINQSFPIKFDEFIPIKYHINSKKIIGNWGVQVGNDDGVPGWLKIILDNSIIYSFSGNRYGAGNDKDDIIYNTDSKIAFGQQEIDLTIQGHYVDDFNFEIEIEFIPSVEQIQKWQTDQFNKIKKQYEKLLGEYESKLIDVIDEYKKHKEESSKEENARNKKQPSNLRQIELIALKRNCLSYLMDEENTENLIREFGTNLYKRRDEFTDILINKSHKLDEYTAFVRFLEQAFEWNDMSYTFYPYYWGQKKTWKDNYNQDNVDLLFKAFMQAGMARVILTVRKGWEDAVNLYMTTGKIWQGGNLPIYGSSLFLSIADEMKDNQDYEIEGEWESVLPTNLIALQSSGVAIDQSGLPNLDEKGNLGLLEPNDKKIKRKRFFGLF